MGRVSHVMVLTMLFGGLASQYDNGYLNPDENEQVYCYQCSSQRDSDCKDIDPNNMDAKYKFNLPCLDTEKYNGSRPFCRKTTQKIFSRDNMEIVIRSCGWVKHPRLECYNVKNEDHLETSCQCFESGCNEATVYRQSVVLGMSGLVLGLLTRRCDLLHCFL